MTHYGVRWLPLLAMALTACGSDPIDDVEQLTCAPGADATWVTEGDEVRVVITCLGEDQLTSDSFVMDELPAGASFESATGVLNWVPGLDQAAVWQLTVVVAETGESGTVTIGVADAYDAPGNVPVVDPEAYPAEFGIPVLFLDHGPAESENDEPVVVTYGGRTIDARGEKRGASSLSYPKNSYLLKFESDAQFYDLDRDFVGKRRIVLTSTFDDNAYLRQRLVFELWNALEPSLPIRTYSVVVYIGGEYWGLYTLTDHPSKHWLESLNLRGDANLYKAYNHDANFRSTDNGGNPKGTLSQGFEKKEGTPGDFADIEDLVSFAINSTSGDFAAQLGDRISVADYNKWWALVVFTLATDSAGKNSYHYRDGTSSDDKWVVAPWDFNASFGQSWETSRLPATSVPHFENRNEIFRRSLEDATLGPALRAVLRDAITDGPFSEASLDARVGDLITELAPSADRDWRKWAGDYATHPRWQGRSDMTDNDGELTYLLEWIDARRTEVLSTL